MTILRTSVIEAMIKIMCLIKLQVWKQFLALIIIDAIFIIFYKTTLNARLVLNSITTKFFNLFYAGILAFLFTIIHYIISEYQSGNKVIKLFNGKIAQSVYYHIQFWLQ